MGIYANQEIRAGRSYRQEFRYRRRDGELRWLAEDVHIEPLGPGQWRAVGVCTDITRLKEIQEELRLANQAKDDFLSMLAHELRNPLAPIRNAVELLRHAGPDGPRLQRAREIIERQTEHLVRLVDDLLDVSRITRNKIALQCECLDLVALVSDAVEVRRSVLESAGLKLALDLPREPVWIEGDATRLTQVVSNLIHNAAKFSDPGGWVTVRVVSDPECERAQIVVRDTGIGIDA
jgi:signal transduction histidine kinase